ncbi:MAG TPA: segregation/condensation protein A [Candidatus Norongarragalinales archaeon]|nr:segregation/condensation protein A [Candidatus Norongarragalinales archaeon]
MDLLEVIVQPTWKEFLIDLVESEKMDPWDVDISQVADAYLQKVKDLQSMDLRIPANVILASSLLLRFKSDALGWKEDEEDYYVDEPLLIAEDIPQLIVRSNRPRSRRVTLEELMKAVDSVIKQGRKIHRIIPSPIAISISLPQKTIGQRISEVFEKAQALKDADELVLFSELSEGKTIEFFMPMLHLVNSQKIDVWQDEFFGEIFLKILAEDLGDVALKAENEEKRPQTPANA